ncbi:hypothetical protein ACSN2V_004089 [Vibrio parahaemolyticus]|uniref:hypothetical protein n=1 Tax=Vibrio harveyi group TaxID=717610 RepID=UPI001118E294|nr:MULTISPECIES: hypothetical protein [Vibrio harveyi group]HAS6253017.1 hypothetical protein [Vibrio vulnificus]EHR1202595.1 hypothetical protein [Vibrio parahaemolyticus]MBT0087068.1 hypothetical protein [Vibrio alginolyticus]MDF4641995.1 hypothetical protein [Vibrio parahaemolyticus]HAS3040367.1 hypothetical protein [Vibrio parahaemolyticus]
MIYLECREIFISEEKMPRKPTENAHYAVAAREFLKAKRKDMGGSKPFFKALYGHEPTASENQSLINLLNRGNLSAEFLGLCADKLNLTDTTVFELFGLRKPPRGS